MDTGIRPIAWHLDCDILKAEEGHHHGERVRFVSGIASEETPDQVGETVVHNGVNFAPLLKTGYINYDHLSHPSRSDLGPEALIGVPTDARLTKSDAGVPALYVEGYLFDDPVLKPLADACWRHMQQLALTKNLGTGRTRRMGFSVEGVTLMKVRGRIERSEIRQLAITHKPAHLGTPVDFQEVLKSLNVAASLSERDFLGGDGFEMGALLKTADTGIDQPLLREDLHNADGSRVRKSRGQKAMRHVFGQGCTCGEFDPRTGKCKHGRASLLKHMTQCAGWDRGEAEAFTTLMKSVVAD
jgi:hypothetical protein